MKAAAALSAAILWVIPLWTAPAKASEIDLSTWSCKQFQSAAKDRRAQYDGMDGVLSSLPL